MSALDLETRLRAAFDRVEAPGEVRRDDIVRAVRRRHRRRLQTGAVAFACAVALVVTVRVALQNPTATHSAGPAAGRGAHSASGQAQTRTPEPCASLRVAHGQASCAGAITPVGAPVASTEKGAQSFGLSGRTAPQATEVPVGAKVTVTLPRGYSWTVPAVESGTGVIGDVSTEVKGGETTATFRAAQVGSAVLSSVGTPTCGGGRECPSAAEWTSAIDVVAAPARP